MAEAGEMRRDIAAIGRGENGQYFANECTDRVGRMEIMVDRGQGSVAVLVYCDSQADAREVERIMDGMSPHRGGWGKRVSSEVYEVVLDEATGRQAVQARLPPTPLCSPSATLLQPNLASRDGAGR